MQRIVINTGYGFSLSRKALDRLRELGHVGALNSELRPDLAEFGLESYSPWPLRRNDPLLLQVLDELGLEESAGSDSPLKVVEIPDGVEWDIGEKDSGSEWVYEKHRIWF